MKNIKSKKANVVGIAIIVMAALLLLGSIFVDSDNSNSKSKYLEDKNSNDDTNNDNPYPEETYLFYMNSTNIGRQNKITTSFPNVELGAQVEYNIVHLENNFKLKANPFTNNIYSFNVNFNNKEEVDGFYLYFDLDRIGGKQDLVVKVDDEIIYQNQARPTEIPLIVNKKLKNQSSVKISFEALKPSWYRIFNWNSFEIKNLKVMEIRKNKDNNIRTYNFDVDKANLERMDLNIVVDCKKEMDATNPIKINVNGYTLADFNPKCDNYINKITTQIPLNVLKVNGNEIEMKTKGYYNLAYSFNKIYYNDKDTYKFTVGSFNDIIDVIMYGDFDKEVIDIKVNTQTMSLKRDEIKSIIPYLRYGTNTIEFLTKPLEIKEFIVEKNEFIY